MIGAMSPALLSPSFPGYPRGWFAVALSDEIRVGELHRMQYFGQQLLAHRLEEGGVVVLDAYCPHLGADLRVGGEVVEGSVRCPFHHWRFGADGACVDVPYAKSIPKRAGVRAWETVEKNGLVFVHYDPGGESPAYELPDVAQLGDAAWTGWHHVKLRLKTHSREIVENVVDIGHFEPVHRNAVLTFENEFVGHRAIQRQKGVGLSAKATAEFVIEATYYGPGYQLSEMDSVAPTVMYNAHTMVDEEYVDLRFGVMIQPGESDARSSAAYVKGYVHHLANGFRQDAAIWEHKRWRDRPILCDGDGPIHELREWYAQFF